MKYSDFVKVTVFNISGIGYIDLLDIFIFVIYTMIILSIYHLQVNNYSPNLVMFILMVIIAYRNIVLGIIALIMFIIKYYLPKEEFKQKNHKDEK